MTRQVDGAVVETAILFVCLRRLQGVRGSKALAFQKLAKYVHTIQGLLLQELRANISSSAQSAAATASNLPCTVLNVVRGGPLTHADVELRLEDDTVPPRAEDLLVLRPGHSVGRAQAEGPTWFDSRNRLALVTKSNSGVDDKRAVLTLAVKLLTCAPLPHRLVATDLRRPSSMLCFAGIHEDKWPRSSICGPVKLPEVFSSQCYSSQDSIAHSGLQMSHTLLLATKPEPNYLPLCNRSVSCFFTFSAGRNVVCSGESSACRDVWNPGSGCRDLWRGSQCHELEAFVSGPPSSAKG
jgi:hypothetical protein